MPKPTEAERVEELATNESYDVLWGALYAALEADLSSKRWPEDSKKWFEEISLSMDNIVTLANNV